MANSSHLIPDKATNISVSPTGNLSSNNVQDALVELQTDIDGLGGGGAGGMLVPLQTQTVASSVASVAFSASIDNSYSSYLVVFREVRESTTNENNLVMGISTDNGVSYDFNANYPGYIQTIDDTGTLATVNMNTASGCLVCPKVQSFNAEGGHGFGQVLLRNPSNAGTDVRLIEVRGTTIDLDAGLNQDHISYWGGARRAAIGPINAISFQFQSGTIDGGVFTLYGVADA